MSRYFLPVSGFDAKQFWEQRLQRDYSLKGVGYESLGKGFNYWLYRIRRHLFRQEVNGLGLQPAAAKVLDIGSGTGFYLTQLQSLGFRNVTGSDLTETAVGHLQQNFSGYQVVQMDISSGELPLEERFDLITCFDVLFHIVDDTRFDQAIANVARLLKPGGVFLFSDNFAHKEERRTHHVSRSRKDIETSLRKAGLEPGPTQAMFVLLNEPARSESGSIHNWWKGVVLFHRYLKPLGWLTGALLYPLEKSLLAQRSEGPSTLMMRCRKAT